jgi:peroxiredoxin Q/BCP
MKNSALSFKSLLALVFMLTGLTAIPAAAVEVGQPAPDFTMPSTTGGDISLKDFRSKKWVLLEFYGADFAPT